MGVAVAGIVCVVDYTRVAGVVEVIVVGGKFEGWFGPFCRAGHFMADRLERWC